MNIAGIIAEYNPLHSGHVFHINKTKELLGQDTKIIVVMSGHVVQRGEFPILTKWSRAEMALQAGADIVLELPAQFACACANRFAKAGVQILQKLGVVTHLSFGSELGDVAQLTELANIIKSAKYPKDISLARAIPIQFPEFANILTPNNILAIEYIHNLIGSGISPITVQRSSNSHDDDNSSAMAMRKKIKQHNSEINLPYQQIFETELLHAHAPIKMPKHAMLARLRSMSLSDFEKLPENSGGFHNRLYNAVQTACSIDQLYEFTKSKRYTMSRVRRAIMCAYLGISENHTKQSPHIRLLGIGKSGRELLSQMQNVELISKASNSKKLLSLESHITDQMSVFMPKSEKCGLEFASKLRLYLVVS